MAPLTQSEERILGMLYRGLIYKGIAQELPCCSLETLKTRIQRITRKTGAHRPREAVYLWRESKGAKFLAE